MKNKYFQMIMSKYKKLVLGLAIIVVFATTYALVLPAITLDKDAANQDPAVSLEQVRPIENVDLLDNPSIMSMEGSLSDPVDDSTKTSSSDALPQTEAADEQRSEEQGDKTEEEQFIEEASELVYEGSDYRLTVDFDGSAKLPVGVELKVEEIQKGSASYETYYDKVKENLAGKDLTYAKFLDISFVGKDGEVKPAAPVQVSIQYDDGIKVTKGSSLAAAHFDDDQTIQLLPVEAKVAEGKASTLRFTAEHFSVYGIVQSNAKQVRRIVVSDKNYYTVRFVYTDKNGNEQVISTLIDVEENAVIGSLPEEPFKAGYRFVGWKNKATGEDVTEATKVTDDMTVEAKFDSIDVYTVEAEYYYKNGSTGEDVVFDRESFQIEESNTPYDITPPPSTKVLKENDPSLPQDAIFYPSQPSIQVQNDLRNQDIADGQEDHHITKRLEYLRYDATFKFVYKLKKLDGSGYETIEEKEAHGFIGRIVNAQILSYPYANFERTDSVEITQASGQEIPVYYTRRTFALSYDTNGGTYIAPQNALYESQVSLTTTIPTKTGYEFVGWYDNPELTGSQITGEVTLDKNKTVYAKWKAKTVNYTVAYYKEVYNNATGTTDYVFDTSRTAQASVGSRVQASNASNPPSGTSIGVGYEKDTAKNASSSVEVAADGTSVLKVYYKLIRYTFIFDLANNNAKISMNGESYSNREYQITDVVLGKDISNQWPSSTSNPKEVYDDTLYGPWYRYYFDYWSPNFKTKRYEVTADMLPTSGTTRTYTAHWTYSSAQRNVEYWLEQPDGTYQKSDEYSQSFIGSGTLQPKDIYGYSYYTNQTFRVGNTYYYGTSGSTYRFYYKRKSYSIKYVNRGATVDTKTGILFDSDINTSTYNDSYIPPRPTEAGKDFSDYTWKGWYADSYLTEKYSFDKMPAHNMTLYANWKAPEFTVSFDVNGGDSPTPAGQTVEKYKQANYPGAPSRVYYEFDGWYTDPTGGNLYDWTKPVTADVHLYAHWRLKQLSYTVRYVDKETGNVLSAEKVETSPALTIGQTITEKALAITGYRPDAREKSVALDYDNNVITFEYVKKSATITYKVKYVLASNESIEVAPEVSKTVDGSYISVREVAKEADKTYMSTQAGVTPDMLDVDYYPLQNIQDLILTANDEDNVLIFRYADYHTAKIKINYLDMDGDPIPGQESKTILQKKPAAFQVEHTEISGFTYAESSDNQGKKNKVIYRIQDGTENYVINLYYKKDITLEARRKEKVYDGTALTSSGKDDLESSYQFLLKAGDSLTDIDFDGSQTEVGSSLTKPKDALIKTGSTDHTDYYNITYRENSLVVTPHKVIVTIEGDKKEKVYDGFDTTVNYQVNINDSQNLYEESDIRFTGTSDDASVTQKDAGDYILDLQNKFINNNPNFTVEFQVSNGRLLIKPRRLTLMSPDKEKSYDGTALTSSVNDITIKATDPTSDYLGFVAGEGVKFTVTGSQTGPGKSENSFTYSLLDTTKAQNYELTQEFGHLTVTPTLNLQKTNQDFSKALVGAKFTLTKWDGSRWLAVGGYDTLSVDSTDGLNITGLGPGRYRLEERVAPAGYVTLGKAVYFIIQEDGNSYTLVQSDENGTAVNQAEVKLLSGSDSYSSRLQVANTAGVALPHTGGAGTAFYIITGLILMAVSTLGAYRMKCKRERRF